MVSIVSAIYSVHLLLALVKKDCSFDKRLKVTDRTVNATIIDFGIYLLGQSQREN